MWEGSETLDHSLPPEEQPTVPGYDPGRSWSLVRNPSWDESTDPLRPAYVDAIQVEINESTDVNFNKFQDGGLDLIFDGVPPKQVLQQYTTDPELKESLHVNPSDGLRYISFNLAQPPFDDLFVRQAFSVVLDKDLLRRTRGGTMFGEIAQHIIPDTLLDFQLQDYVPSWGTSSPTGDVEAAKALMAQSKYDKNGDGSCEEAPECSNVLLIADQEDPYPDQNAVIEDNAAELGISFDIRSGDRYTFMYDTCDDPTAQWALCPSVGWFKDYADAFTFGFPLLHSDAIESSNYALLGADSKLLGDAGYDVTEVPTADEQIDACALEPVGDSRISCWAEVDRLVMEEMVPMVPWLFDNDVDIAGPRILNYTNDAMSGLMALEQIALADAGETAA
jgi:peptide/nickel transport system substrate-binding protein